MYPFISHGGLMRTCRLPLLYSVSRLAVLFFTGLHRRVPPVGNIIVYVCRLKFSDIDRCSCNSLHILCCIHSRLQVGRFFSYPFVEVCPCNNSLSRCSSAKTSLQSSVLGPRWLLAESSGSAFMIKRPGQLDPPTGGLDLTSLFIIFIPWSLTCFLL